jgi:hypothetical protein
MASQTVKQFVTDAYQLISPNTPSQPLYGDDMSKGVQFLNELLLDYSANGLLLTIAKRVDFTVSIGQEFITFGTPDYVPTPNVITGRLANLENAWLTLDGVTYPLIDESRNVFYGSYKYDPQLGLPRFCIITNDNNLTMMRIYPAPSQVYTLSVYGKFELLSLSENGDMSSLPNYYLRYLKLALAYELAFYKGRSSAWDEKLQKKYDDSMKIMESVSTVNLVVDTGNESYLNGSWRVRAGV